MKRRTAVAGLAAAGIAAVAGLYRFTGLFARHYPPTPYDDVLAQLTDREQAVVLGRRVAGAGDVGAQARHLRALLQGRTLASAASADIATGRMVEVAGWILPQTVAQLAALAARV